MFALKTTKMKNHLLIALLCFLNLEIISQNSSIGSWTDHLSYEEGRSVAFDGEKVYCGTKNGLFSFNLNDNSIQRYSTINMLSDIGIEKVAYNDFNGTLCIFYTNGNMDFYKNGKTTNVAFLKNNNVFADKILNKVYFRAEYAYLSYNFGIVKVNTDKKEITETYQLEYLGSKLQIKSTAIHKDSIYAATNSGLFKANINDNLLDFYSWEKTTKLNLQSIEDVFSFNNKLYVVGSDTAPTIQVENNSSWSRANELRQNIPVKHIIVRENELLIAYSNAIVKYNNQLEVMHEFNYNFILLTEFVEPFDKHFFVSSYYVLDEFKNKLHIKNIRPNGPLKDRAYSMESLNGSTWVASGSPSSSYSNTFQYPEVFHFDGQSWRTYNPQTNVSFEGKFDILDISINPSDNKNIFISSWGRGIIEMKENQADITYNHLNSSLVSRVEDDTWVGVGGSEFDKEGNLWITNSYNTQCLSVKKIDGSWQSYEFPGLIVNTTAVGDVIVSDIQHKWIELPKDNSILIFDDNGTLDDKKDDRKLKLSSAKNSGNIEGIRGLNMALDLNGDMWIGSDNGIAVFYNADNIFDNYSIGAQKILIDEGENVEVLLDKVSIKDIKIDGDNRKWIATEGSGVFLLSPDGTKEIHHFTTNNSPIYSNNISSISVDNKTGEVFIGTVLGIISYRSDATEGQESFSNVNIFPNPVRSSYTGPISINGLMPNSTVKITDISGNLINEIRSTGGQVIWNGNNFKGERASSGVYLLFYSANQESNDLKSEVGKILFVK